MIFSYGTAFMVAPEVIVSTAHVLHMDSDPNNPLHQQFEVIRAPDIGQSMETAQLIVEDCIRDVVMLRILHPRSDSCLTLEPKRVSIGTSCGSIGFPLAFATVQSGVRKFDLIERFQGGHISSFHTQRHSSGRHLSYYETDRLMYRGSSGCPGFLVNANVFGMHVQAVVEEQDAAPTRHLAISWFIPSMDIITFAQNNGVTI
jgi:hypothetical protein